MIIFVTDRFQNKDDTIGNVSTHFNDYDTALMEYHAKLASHYNPTYLQNTKWAYVEMASNSGEIYLHEFINKETVE